MVTEMYGTCDGYDIIFKNEGGDLWTTIVPADLEDGRYIISIYAKLDSGEIIYYAGILYICNCKLVSLEILDDDIYAKFSSYNSYDFTIYEQYASFSEKFDTKVLEDKISIGVIIHGN